MGKRKSNKDKLEIYKFKHMDLFFEVPIIIGSTITDYTITRFGDVISYKGYGTDKPVKLTPVISENGYLKVNLHVDGKMVMKSVHRLVAKAFITNPDNKPEVNHKDGDKTNNRWWNLEWATSKENIDHAYNTGLAKGKKGEDHPMHKVNKESVIMICRLLETGKYSYSEIADMTKSSYSIVKKIKNGYRWTEISKNYDFSKYNKRRKKHEKAK